MKRWIIRQDKGQKSTTQIDSVSASLESLFPQTDLLQLNATKDIIITGYDLTITYDTTLM